MAKKETKYEVKAYFLDSVFGILRLRKKPSKAAPHDKVAEREFLKHDNYRHQAQASLRFKPH